MGGEVAQAKADHRIKKPFIDAKYDFEISKVQANLDFLKEIKRNLQIKAFGLDSKVK